MGLNYYHILKKVREARKLVIRGITAAGSGHPGGSFSMAEIMGCIYHKYLRHDPKNPLWPDRDRLVLSKGHASPGLFSNLAVAGYFDKSEIETLRKFESRLQGHPDYKCPGVEFCGGSLGLGLSFSTGMALAARIDGKKTHIYTIIGDGESDEGQVWEGAMAASKFKLDNLTVFVDRNFIQQDDYTERVMPLDEELIGDDISEMWKNAARWKVGDKWRSFGWNVLEIDGHRIEQIVKVVSSALQTRGTPSIIVARTIKGKSVEHMEDNPKWHGVAPSPQISPIIELELDCQFLIAPSLIAGDMTNLENEVKRSTHGRADLIHLDVMDGVFVPNKTFDHEKIRQLRSITQIPFDAHLMISEPVKKVKNYVDAGCDIITVHAEVCDESSFGEIHDVLRSNDVSVGMAINPETQLPSWAEKFIPDLDQLIVMSVLPGKSGQKYIESTHEKTQKIAKFLAEKKFDGFIEADGGVDLTNVEPCFLDGARVFVGGSAIIGQKDVRATIVEFRKKLMHARRKLLIHRAYSLGGAELVNRWIDLHEVGKKKMELLQIAKEAGFV
ncbi:MAG: ribulose phosphate epimerase [Thaumarchaeota archaeon 13_1_20CM_2_39_20]|nr:MAG: ribulose phosphate epimerase [Thaumarchaeota archaeon 13_1_40CM_2_39_13_1]OLE40577.1 MAG: ribulose phosphate epimerase [Thaumarchaeota archaeon 13_1_20CM_2_39_20]